MTEHREQAGTGRKPRRSRRAPAGGQAAAEAARQAHIERIVNAAPPFTAGQRARLAAIFNGAAPATGRTDRRTNGQGGGRA
jgi:hypothetical protein